MAKTKTSGKTTKKTAGKAKAKKTTEGSNVSQNRLVEMKRSITHIGETNPLRRKLWHMDKKVQKLITGIQQGDDSITIGNMLYNMEGPYPLKIGMKTGLIHSCSDIVVMGGKPLFALNAMQVDSVEQSVEVAEGIKKQSEGLGVPVIGGNTQLENDLKPCVSFVVVGELVLDKIIADSTLETGDHIVMLGDPVEGDIGDRVQKANVKFKTFIEVAKAIKVHASKDASRGGWFGNLMEILIKSKKGFNITGIPHRSFSRYLGTYMISVDPKDIPKIASIAAKNGCPAVDMGEVTAKMDVVLGDDVLVNEKEMQKLIRESPFKKPNY